MSDTGDYVHGEMDVQSQEATYNWFLTATAWTSVLLMVVLGYAIFTLTMSVHWMVALPVFAILAVLAGQLMGLGAGFMITIGGLVFIGLFVQLLIFLGSLMM